MSLAVIDASVFAVFYAADDPRHALVVERLKVGDALFAPAHLDAEIVSALRAMARSNKGLDLLVPRALTHLAGFPIRRMPLPAEFTRGNKVLPAKLFANPGLSRIPTVDRATE